MNTHPISVIIITQNEERNIRRCLQSVAWADEIIVLDSGSTDNTIAICQEFTDHVFLTDWPGFGVQKGRALAKTTHNWVLSIDADEEITPSLKEEILKILCTETNIAGFKIRRQSRYCGKILNYGGWGKDYVLRLFKKAHGQFTEDILHESVVVSGPIAQLKEPMNHYTRTNFEDELIKMNLYTTLGAEKDFKRGRRGSLLKAILKAYWKFVHTYFLKFGFLDGKYGFLMALTGAHGTFYKNIKLMVLEETSSPHKY